MYLPADIPTSRVARYNVDGSLDTSFGTGGEVSTSFGPTNDDAYSVTLQADGKIVVAGASDFSKHLALVRYNVDGSLDASFGSGGLLTTTVPNGSGEAAKSVKIQPDGKILVAGYSFIGGNNSDFAAGPLQQRRQSRQYVRNRRRGHDGTWIEIGCRQ